ncbi:MAG: poly-beta-1,6 N-acetyl-D-glucosamine synthase [Lachnospiraceae bacterium]|nr:poly-beta-1,6 N-acetyl-D-glucosamine synthase [Lachnospiraceae bacterium]MBQ8263095.1 poly-beta-1,6 N-acetyl-D-glucosamine synthase [Lachnospiraceae bacterium]
MLRYMELFVFWYPAIMSMAWIVGGIMFYISNERRKPLPLNKTPMVSILVPCYNEAETIENTVRELSKIQYPNYEIIVINDGSSDNTEEVAYGLLETYEKMRFINLKENNGKANALYLGLIAANGEILVGVDSDSYLMPDALDYFVPHFTNPYNGERVGAVTGNPRVRNRNTLLAKLQLCEYASIISLIKRTQRIWGKVMTVSGVVVAFRKRALLDCELWDRDMITEDIGVTWKLEKKFWDVRYEPNALCMMLVPETVKGLRAQRRRWTQGGMEILRRHFDIFRSWKTRRMVAVYLEQITTIAWAICWLILTIILVVAWIRTGEWLSRPYIWKSLFLSVVCIIQFTVAMILDSRYDKHLFRNAVTAIWYPFLYWYINAIIVIASLPSLFKKRKTTAKWESPDRGL